MAFPATPSATSLHILQDGTDRCLRSCRETIESARNTARAARDRLGNSRTTSYNAVQVQTRLLQAELERVRQLEDELERQQLYLGLRLLSLNSH
jgi:hypothetical protein